MRTKRCKIIVILTNQRLIFSTVKVAIFITAIHFAILKNFHHLIFHYQISSSLMLSILS